MKKNLELTNIIIPKEAENLSLPLPELVQYYKNLERRVYWLDTDVDESTLELARLIMQWNYEDRGIPTEQRKRILIVDFSYGGMLEVCNSLIDIIKLSKTPVHCLSAGVSMSAGAFIYLACHKRYALKRTTFLLHSGSCENMSGTAEQIQSSAENYKRQVNELKQYLVEDCGLDKSLVQRKLKQDWYLTATEALNLGLVDEIVTDIDDIL